MSPDAAWEGARLAGILTTYIVGIEDTVKPVILRAVAHAIMVIDEPFDTLGPIVGRALAESDVNLPGDERVA